jgi:hypothetical protein
MSRQNLTVEDVLYGLGVGEPQSVANMEMFPLIAEDERGEVAVDDDFAPPDSVQMGTRAYGEVEIVNSGDRATIVPPGASWVVSEKAQDHAIGGGKILGPGERTVINTAMCIQSSQSGTITVGNQEMTMLPAELRSSALALRGERNYEKLWGYLKRFNGNHGLSGESSLVYFLETFKKQMDEFVAEFENVRNQVGAIILVDNRVVGIEVAPTREYWESIWIPLIRVCYGSLAKVCYKGIENVGDFSFSNRLPLSPKEKTLTGLVRAVKEAKRRKNEYGVVLVNQLATRPVLMSGKDGSSGTSELFTVAVDNHENPAGTAKLGGQMVVNSRSKVPYFSVCMI